MTRSAGWPNDPMPSPTVMASNLPPPMGPPHAEVPPGFVPHTPSPTRATPPPHGRRTLALRIGLAVLAVVGLGVAAAIVLTRDDGGSTPTGEGGAVTSPDATEVPAEDLDDDKRFLDAEAAYQDGRCDAALALYDELVADTEWMASSDAAPRVMEHQGECTEFLGLATTPATDPPLALAGYLAFLDDHPRSAMADEVTGQAQELYATSGWTALTVDTCDLVPGYEGLVAPSDSTDVRLGCATAYDAAGRTDDSYALALQVLDATTNPSRATQALQLVARSPQACSELDQVREVADLAAHPDEHAALLQSCMAVATSANDLATLADLQVAFLTAFPQHPSAPAVEAALVENVSACDLLSEMETTPELAIRAGFVASKYLACAQFAEFVGDVDLAVGRYQWFVDHAAGDARMDTALAGLARGRISQARTSGADIFELPGSTGGTGSSRSELVIYNDAPQALQVIVTGPETRFETIPASPTSTEYSLVGPLFCRSDVPSLTISLAPGTYEVMLDYDTVAPSVGTWVLESGREYAFCNYIVSSFSYG